MDKQPHNLDIQDLDGKELHVVAMDWDQVGTDDFLGEVRKSGV